jgi:hypothetical protein
MTLPDYAPVTEEVKLPDDWDITYSQSALFPPIKKFPDGRLIVDMWADGKGGKVGKAWTKADHVNLTKLPPNTPRPVKSLYTADGQLAYIRGDYDRAIKADQAWESYLLNVELAEIKRRIRLEPGEEHFSENFDWSPSGVLWKRGERFAEFRP